MFRFLTKSENFRQKVIVFIAISWRNLKNINCLISLVYSDYLVIFKFGNSNFDLKDNIVNNYKNSNALHFKFLCFKII